MHAFRLWLARKLLGKQVIFLSTGDHVITTNCESIKITVTGGGGGGGGAGPSEDDSIQYREWTLYDDCMWEGPDFDGEVDVVERSAFNKAMLINTRLRATIRMYEFDQRQKEW